MAQITDLQATNTLGTDDQTILRQGLTDKRISLELAATLSWAKRNEYIHVGEHTTGLIFPTTESFSTYQGKVYFVKEGVSLPYTAVSNTPSSDSNLTTQSLSEKNGILKYRVGQKVAIHSTQIPDWLLKADGSNGISRTVDDVLWEHASTSGLVVNQATKDANPEQYAMYYGDGDGSTTFSLPNWYLGHFARGNPAGVALGETQGDTIRNILGAFSGGNNFTYSGSEGSGAIRITGNLSAGESLDRSPLSNLYSVYRGIDFDASRIVPTSNENRPKSGHITVCIERGKIPS
ncbi:hypothetical protein NVP1063O_063 [Vibrio phage 1.063.O._10N.261.45.C7]|nr:hypothetical protein NVP1063O_063 [Vibrio phage 1.063.O._10N.261.45.C7]